MTAPGAHLMLVDGGNLLHRAFHTLREPSLALLPDRVHAMLLAAVRRWGPTYLMVALDSDSPVRKATIPGYKANRAKATQLSIGADESGDEAPEPTTAEMTAAVRPALERWGVAVREAS